MSPLMIKIALSYYTSTDGYKGVSLGSPAYTEAIGSFVADGMLVDSDRVEGELMGTKKLEAFCEHLCTIPLPVHQWVIPT